MADARGPLTRAEINNGPSDIWPRKELRLPLTEQLRDSVDASFEDNYAQFMQWQEETQRRFDAHRSLMTLLDETMPALAHALRHSISGLQHDAIEHLVTYAQRCIDGLKVHADAGVKSFDDHRGGPVAALVTIEKERGPTKARIRQRARELWEEDSARRIGWVANKIRDDPAYHKCLTGKPGEPYSSAYICDLIRDLRPTPR